MLGAEEPREKHRWNQSSKVYARKIRNKNNSISIQNSTNTDVDATNNENDNTHRDEITQNHKNNASATPNNADALSPLQSCTAEDANSHHQHPKSSNIGVVSDDSTSLNQKEGSALHMPLFTRVGNKVSVNLPAAMSKHERRELKRKLVSELEEIKCWAKRLEDKMVQLSGYDYESGRDDSQHSMDDGLEKDGGSVGFDFSRPFQQLSVPVMDNCLNVMEISEIERRAPMAKQCYRNSEVIYGNRKFRPVGNNRKSKANGSRKQIGGSGFDYQTFRKCSSLLTKLMKRPYGWVFNTPVDVKSMGLHDYYDIIKHPMDLGTVKSRLNKKLYKSPLQFAEDVRLTFRNAMTYNPEGHDVHTMAVDLSNIFEERWVEIEADYNCKLRPPSPLCRETGFSEGPEPIALPVEPIPKPVYNPPPIKRAPALKKPKAKDPDKRDMTVEEKRKLGDNLQALPLEKLDSVVEIIKKRNATVCQGDDVEVEVDIDSVDAETLWELDRFVTNYKKSLSKHKRKAELARQRAEAQQNEVPPITDVPDEKRADHTNAAASAPVHERKHTVTASRSSSSSSSSSDSGSSSSDSDSDSSSGSESN